MGNFPYVQISIGDGKTMRLHRYLMEQHLGRKLGREEVVHHINHDRLDNRIENLEVQTLGDHSVHHNTKHGASKCRQCGTANGRHSSSARKQYFPRGLCNSCYKRERKAETAAPRAWARNAGHSQCVLCGTTDVKHHSKGRCCRCYEKAKRAARVAAGMDLRGH